VSPGGLLALAWKLHGLQLSHILIGRIHDIFTEVIGELKLTCRSQSDLDLTDLFGVLTDLDLTDLFGVLIGCPIRA